MGGNFPTPLANGHRTDTIWGSPRHPTVACQGHPVNCLKKLIKLKISILLQIFVRSEPNINNYSSRFIFVKNTPPGGRPHFEDGEKNTPRSLKAAPSSVRLTGGPRKRNEGSLGWVALFKVFLFFAIQLLASAITNFLIVLP